MSKINDVQICGLNLNLISSDIIKQIKEMNILITVYSDKNISLFDARKLFNLGVDSIFVDNPIDLLKKI